MRQVAHAGIVRSVRPVHLIRVPYDSGHRGVRMGAGPLRLWPAERLRAQGCKVTEACIEAPAGFQTEIGTGFQLYRALAVEVRAAHDSGRFPLVVSGNCGAALGALAGGCSAVAWFDGHGDFNTPETSRSGFLDGMALAMATGRCFRGLANSIPGFAPVADCDAFLVGARDIDPEELSALDHSGVGWVRMREIRSRGVAQALQPALSLVRSPQIHVHVDLDVHEPSLAPANQFAPPDGLTPGEVQDAVRAIAARLPIRSASLSAYDPAVDPQGLALEAGMQLALLFAELA